jgi:hypothetical protein
MVCMHVHVNIRRVNKGKGIFKVQVTTSVLSRIFSYHIGYKRKDNTILIHTNKINTLKKTLLLTQMATFIITTKLRSFIIHPICIHQKTILDSAFYSS